MPRRTRVRASRALWLAASLPVALAVRAEDAIRVFYDGRDCGSEAVEVDHVEGPADWRTVIAWGRYEELAGPDADRALDLVMARCPPPSREGVMFRILLDERSGRFASSS